MTDIPNYRSELRESIKLSKSTGQRIRKTFKRDEFLKQFPAAATDPRMAFVGENFVLDVTPLEGISVGELRRLCLAKKDHPLAIQKALSILGTPEHKVVYILREDLDLLRQGVQPVVSAPPVSLSGTVDSSLPVTTTATKAKGEKKPKTDE